MGLLHNIKVRLGLADDWDDEYDDDYYDDDEESEVAQPKSTDGYYGRVAASSEHPYARERSSVTRLERQPGVERGRETTTLRSVSAVGQGASAPPQVRMHITEPKSFSEVQAIADRFKSGTPVIMNLTATKSDLAKRLIDFASGLTYGLDGGLQKISDKVVMLTPANVEVSAEDRRRLRDHGLFDLG